MNRRPVVLAVALGVIVVLGLLLLAVTSDDAEEPAGESPPATASTTTTTTTTTIAPEDIPPLDEEAFDLDREVAPGSEPESLGPIGATETTIATSEGEIQIGGGDVPELAGAFPLPDGFEVQLASEVPGEIGFSGRVDGTLAELAAFYETELPDAGYAIVERQEVPDVLVAMEVTGPLEGDVVISEEPGVDGGWTILIALAEPA